MNDSQQAAIVNSSSKESQQLSVCKLALSSRFMSNLAESWPCLLWWVGWWGSWVRWLELRDQECHHSRASAHGHLLLLLFPLSPFSLFKGHFVIKTNFPRGYYFFPEGHWDSFHLNYNWLCSLTPLRTKRIICVFDVFCTDHILKPILLQKNMIL